MKNVVVIGAGPAGLYSSSLLAKRGYSVKIFDRKKEIGKPVQCTGIVTSKINQFLDVKNCTINQIKNIEVISKTQKTSFSLKNPDLVLDRCAFDKMLSAKALDAGARIQMNKELTSLKNNQAIFNSGKHEFNYLVGADGPNSYIYSILNRKRKKFYYGIQARVKGKFDRTTFKVYLGSVAPNFFAWIVPENNTIARIGLASLNNARSYFREFTKKYRIIEHQAGLIPIYDKNTITQKGNIYLVGDAASQIKSSTGGGIIQSLAASKCLASAITNNTDYHEGWKKAIGKDLSIHKHIRTYLNKFTDKDYDSLLNKLKTPLVKKVLETGSRDYPSKFMIKLLLASPKLLSFVKKIF